MEYLTQPMLLTDDNQDMAIYDRVGGSPFTNIAAYPSAPSENGGIAGEYGTFVSGTPEPTAPGGANGENGHSEAGQYNTFDTPAGPHQAIDQRTPNEYEREGSDMLDVRQLSAIYPDLGALLHRILERAGIPNAPVLRRRDFDAHKMQVLAENPFAYGPVLDRLNFCQMFFRHDEHLDAARAAAQAQVVSGPPRSKLKNDPLTQARDVTPPENTKSPVAESAPGAQTYPASNFRAPVKAYNGTTPAQQGKPPPSTADYVKMPMNKRPVAQGQPALIPELAQSGSSTQWGINPDKENFIDIAKVMEHDPEAAKLAAQLHDNARGGCNLFMTDPSRLRDTEFAIASRTFLTSFASPYERTVFARLLHYFESPDGKTLKPDWSMTPDAQRQARDVVRFKGMSPKLVQAQLDAEARARRVK
jgi:hypothetical protein